VLNTLLKRDFGYYWFETGTPTFLFNLIKQGDMTHVAHVRRRVSHMSIIASPYKKFKQEEMTA
jgi:hypothetical protein